jgi:hypothetical protein
LGEAPETRDEWPFARRFNERRVRRPDVGEGHRMRAEVGTKSVKAFPLLGDFADGAYGR